VVQITSPQPGQRLRGQVVITGYAADRRSPSGSGLNERDIQVGIDGSLYHSGEHAVNEALDYAVPAMDSPEAAAALGPSFARVGFEATWQSCSFPPGPHQLSVWVTSLVARGFHNVANVDVVSEPCAPGEILYDSRASQGPGSTDTLHPPRQDRNGFTAVFADFAAGIDARCVQTSAECRYGLRFRELPGPGGETTNPYYLFEVDPLSGEFDLTYFPPGEDQGRWIIRSTRSSAIRRGAEFNRLAVIAEDDWLRLFVNGQQVGEAHDTEGAQIFDTFVRQSRWPWGWIGWSAFTSAPGGVDVQFRNFVVSTPGPIESLAPLAP
jgi:hypothetical protein